MRNLFNTPFIRSVSMRLLVANNMQNRRPIYTDYTLDTLYDNISVPTALGLELNGCLVNISIQSSDRDIDTLKELVRKKILHRNDDQVFKDTKYQSRMHYIHITDKLPTTIPKDIDVIELLGDPPKDYVFNENDSTCIIFLSFSTSFIQPRLLAIRPLLPDTQVIRMRSKNSRPVCSMIQPMQSPRNVSMR